jgi:hypothetical protein
VLGIAWPPNSCSGGCRGSVWVGVDMWFEVVGRRDEEIAWGGRFGPAKPKTEPCELNFGLGCVKQNAGDR